MQIDYKSWQTIRFLTPQLSCFVCFVEDEDEEDEGGSDTWKYALAGVAATLTLIITGTITGGKTSLHL